MSKKPHEVKTGVVDAGDNAAALPADVIELLREGRDMVKAIHHQNDATRFYVERATEILDAQADRDVKQT